MPSGQNADPRQYERAVEDALQQLDWCIGYLHGIGKTRVARAVARNRSVIRFQLIREPTRQPPSERASRARADGNGTGHRDVIAGAVRT